jgi:predicted metalloprotease with PDZ domain
MGWGVGGPSRGELVRIGRLEIGGYTVAGPIAKLSLQKEGSFSDRYLAANVGAGVLERFHLVFDYGHQRIYFAPNARFAERDRFDQSGLWLNQDGDALRVVDVIPGAPGERAGVKAGERIVAVDGAEIAEGSLVALRERFRTEAPGTEVRLRVVGEDGAIREVVLVLRELV